MSEATDTVTIPVTEYEELLSCTVGVRSYAHAARGEALEGEAQAAARQAVQSALDPERLCETLSEVAKQWELMKDPASPASGSPFATIDRLLTPWRQ